ncbi:MAG: type II toxin-antitoxin system VapC family toxin [Candidatus Dormibacteraceae bacterium]
MIVVDSSVLIAVWNSDDIHHQIASIELKAAMEEKVVIPIIAFSEALVWPYRISEAAGRRAEQQLEAVGDVVFITKSIARKAAQLRSHRVLRFPDALVIATGQELDASGILTFDRRWRSIDDRVRCLF